MYPPTPDESHCTTISQTPAAIVKVAAEAPKPGHGLIVDSPTPVPSATKITVVAAAATAPPRMAPQDIAETIDSTAGADSPSV
jgi:hypothetical protein